MSSKYLDVVLNASIISACLSKEKDIIIPSHNKTGINLQPGKQGSTISDHRNPNYLFIQLGAETNNMTMHDIF